MVETWSPQAITVPAFLYPAIRGYRVSLLDLAIPR
jgi:hypothetical protein